MLGIVQAKPRKTEQVVKLSLQKIIPSDLDKGAFITVTEIWNWNGDSPIFKNRKPG